MKRSYDRQTLASRYLRPMGIESWVSRGARVAAAPAAAQTIAQAPVQPAPKPAAQAPAPLRQTDAEAVEDWLTDHRFQTLAAGADGPLLLVMETAAGSAAADDLLASMLKAIALDMSQQTRLFPDADGVPLPIGQNVRAILLLARLPEASDVAGIAHLRQNLLQHRASGCALAVTIHPDDLLDNNAAKRPAWEDLKRLKGYLDEQQR